jgi:predicted RNA binding protein YcfA (HicA-like mRNA interferase family)
MPKLRVLSGREVLKILSGFEFQEFSQRGSHIKIRRVIAGQTQMRSTVGRYRRSIVRPDDLYRSSTSARNSTQTDSALAGKRRRRLVVLKQRHT